MKKFSSPTQQLGEIGEDIAVRFLEGKGYSIIERNYTKKWGEIDIVGLKQGVTRFVEVKSVSHGTNDVRPEDHMDRNKQERLKRTIETYLVSHKVGEWCFDLLCIFLDQTTKTARIKVLEDIIL